MVPDHGCADFQVRPEQQPGGLDEGEVGLAVAQRRRHRDDGHVEPGDLVGVAGRSVRPGGEGLGQPGVGYVLDTGLPADQAIDDALVGAVSDDREADFGGSDGHRLADVALAHDDHPLDAGRRRGRGLVGRLGGRLVVVSHRGPGSTPAFAARWASARCRRERTQLAGHAGEPAQKLLLF